MISRQDSIKHATCGESHFYCRCGDYQMRFGKFKNKKLSEIYFEDGGKGYLDWCVDNLDPGITRDFIQSFLSKNL